MIVPARLAERDRPPFAGGASPSPSLRVRGVARTGCVRPPSPTRIADPRGSARARSAQNIVGSCDVKFPIRLEGLAYKHSHYSSYEPELFPGLIYRMVQPKVVLLIFVSGKVVLTGGKVRNEIYAAFEQIYPVLEEVSCEPRCRLRVSSRALSL